MSDAPVSGPFLALVVWPSWRGARAARSVVRAWKTVRRWVESAVGVISIKNRRQKPVAAPSGCCRFFFRLRCRMAAAGGGGCGGGVVTARGGTRARGTGVTRRRGMMFVATISRLINTLSHFCFTHLVQVPHLGCP